eukprot:scaffold2671_cov252-Pinguiococcus_pyrenoidosus.AAC.4
MKQKSCTTQSQRWILRYHRTSPLAQRDHSLRLVGLPTRTSSFLSEGRVILDGCAGLVGCSPDVQCRAASDFHAGVRRDALVTARASRHANTLHHSLLRSTVGGPPRLATVGSGTWDRR